MVRLYHKMLNELNRNSWPLNLDLGYHIDNHLIEIKTMEKILKKVMFWRETFIAEL